MLAAEPDIARIIMRAFILRRAGFIAHHQAAVTVIGDPRAAGTLRIHRFLARNGHPYVAARLPAGEADQPVVRLGRDTTLIRLSNREFADRLGISEPLDTGKVTDVLVVGAGPARPLIFAVGDVRSGSTKRVASAVGEGSIVVAMLHSALPSAPSRPPERGRS